MANYLRKKIYQAIERTKLDLAIAKIKKSNCQAMKGLEEVMNYTKGPVRIFNQKEISDNWKDNIESIKQTNKPYPRD